MLALYQLSYLALLVAVSLLLCQYLQGWSVRSHSTWIFRIARNAINPSPDSQVQSDQSQGSWSFSDQPLIIHETKQKTVIALSSSGSWSLFPITVMNGTIRCAWHQTIFSASLSLATMSWNGVKSRWPHRDKGLLCSSVSLCHAILLTLL